MDGPDILIGRSGRGGATEGGATDQNTKCKEHYLQAVTLLLM